MSQSVRVVYSQVLNFHAHALWQVLFENGMGLLGGTRKGSSVKRVEEGWQD